MFILHTIEVSMINHNILLLSNESILLLAFKEPFNCTLTIWKYEKNNNNPIFVLQEKTFYNMLPLMA